MTNRTARWMGASALLTLCSSSYAQGGGSDKASAMLLYDEALKLSAAGKLADACPKYADSQRLDPQLGTLLHLGDCYEKNGQTASAWASFREAAEVASTRSDAREKIARKRAGALEGRLAKLVIEVPKSLQTLGVRVERDGTAVGAATFGVAVPTDPGAHVVTASAPGRAPWSDRVTVTPSSVVKIAIPELPTSGEHPAPTPLALKSAGNAASSSNASDTGNAATPSAPRDAETASSSSGGGQRITGFVVMGAGAVGVAVGTAFGVRYLDRNNAAKEVCPGTMTCEPDQIAAHEGLVSEARSALTASIIGLAAGGVALAGGLILVLTAGSGDAQVGLTPRLDRTGGGLTLTGRW